MIQDIDVGTSMAPVVDDKRKSGNGLKIATAIACIVAVCGIGFGVYGMMQGSNKDKQISDLKNQINSLSSKDDDDGAADEIVDNSSAITGGDPKDYLYIGEWGIKIKIPDGLYIYDYKVKLAETTDFAWYVNAPHIIVSGFTRPLTSSPTIPSECYSLIVARIKGQTNSSLASYDGYSYVRGTDVPCSVDAGYSKEEVDLGGKLLIKEMFSNVDNYSKI